LTRTTWSARWVRHGRDSRVNTQRLEFCFCFSFQFLADPIWGRRAGGFLPLFPCFPSPFFLLWPGGHRSEWRHDGVMPDSCLACCVGSAGYGTDCQARGQLLTRF
jgi:hypothetical protein